MSQVSGEVTFCKSGARGTGLLARFRVSYSAAFATERLGDGARLHRAIQQKSIAAMDTVREVKIAS